MRKHQRTGHKDRINFTLIIRWLAILSLLLISTSASHSSEGVNSSISVFKEASLLTTDDNSLTIKQLIQTPERFRPLSETLNSMSALDKAHWFRLTINNPASESKYFIVKGSESYRLGEMKVYIVDQDDIETLTMQLLPHAFGKHQTRFNLPPQSTRDIFIQLPLGLSADHSKFLSIVTEENARTENANHLALAYLTLGLISGLAVYSLVLFFYTRDVVYFYYSLYVTFSALFLAMHDEIGHQFFFQFPLSIYFHQKILWLVISAGLAALIVFTRQFLDTEKNQPNLDKLLQGLFLLALIIAISSVFIDIQWTINLSMLVSLLGYPILMVIAARAFYLGNKIALIYLLAFVCYILMTIVAAFEILLFDDINASNQSVEYMRIGLIINLFLLSIAVAYRLQLLRQEKLKSDTDARSAIEASILKSQFLANMSHEIRTPINGIIGMGQIIKENAQTKNDLSNSDLLLKSADGLLNVVNDILDFSKIEAGKLDINNESFETGEIFTHVGTLFYGLNNNTNIEFTVDSDGGMPAYLIGDHLRLKQILNNLISNAFKFTEQGSVKLACRCIDSDKENFQRIRYSVTDTGIGMDRESLEKLFMPYQQVDQSSTRKQGGTGLGLTITKQLIELMGGNIGVESTLGEGSEFWFTIDFEIDQIRLKKLQIKREQLRGKKIALVFSSDVHSRNMADHYRSINMLPEVYNVESPIAPVERFDVFLISDFIGEAIKPILSECARHNVPVVISRSNYGLFDENWIGDCQTQFVYIPATSIDVENAIIKVLGGKAISDKQESTTPSNKELPRLNILVAEDNVTNQVVIKALLEILHQHIVIEKDGEATVKAYMESPNTIDLILMDCEMPVMDGYLATQEIRRQESAKGLVPVPIYALTAHALAENHLRCIDAGMNDVLTKPVKIEELRDVLEKIAH